MIIPLVLAVVVGVVLWLRRDKGGGASAQPSLPRLGGRPDAALPSGQWSGIARTPPGPAAFAGRPAIEGQIVVSGLTKQYKKLTAVDDLSFVVEPGRVTGLLGPNGAGKTTALRMILGLVTPTAGNATISGAPYADITEPSRHVGGILEASAAHRGRTGRNHLRIICQSAGIPLARADEVLEIVGLAAAGNRLFKGYSLGMRQRLGIAAALIGDPAVLILDEPSNGLDPEGIRWMRDLLKALAAAGRTILVSSHLLSEMQLLADDLIIIAAGRLIAQGTVASVIDSMPSSGRILVRTPDVEILAAALDGDAVVTPCGDGGVYVTGVDATTIGDAAQRVGVTLHQLTTERPDLEDVFLELTKGQATIR